MTCDRKVVARYSVDNNISVHELVLIYCLNYHLS